MIHVGLTGGIATGKSKVSQYFKKLGAFIIDADALAHQVIRPGTAAWRSIRKTFGSGIIKVDQSIDRKQLAHIVFHDPKKLKQLNAIVHPHVFKEENRLARAIGTRHPRAVIIFEAPLLIETGSYRRMSKVILVYVDQKTQIQRLMIRNGLSRTEAKQRIASQAPNAVKMQYADYLIDGRDPPRSIYRQVVTLYKALQTLA